MKRLSLFQSIIPKLLVILLVVGSAVSLTVNVINWQIDKTGYQCAIQQRIQYQFHRFQDHVNLLAKDQNYFNSPEKLHEFIDDSLILAVRLDHPDGQSVRAGNWEQIRTEKGNACRVMMWEGIENSSNQSLRKNANMPMVVMHSYVINDQVWQLYLGIDATPQWHTLNKERMGTIALSMAGVIFLFVALAFCMRRWLHTPLKQIQNMVNQQAPAVSYHRLAEQHSNEFGQLADAIGEMLGRINADQDDYQSRELILQDLFGNAPASLFCIDLEGRVVHANKRSAEMLNLQSSVELLNQDAFQFVYIADRPKLKEMITRMSWQESCRCDMRMLKQDTEHIIDVSVDAVGVRDEYGNLKGLRLAIVDISHAKDLQRQLQDKTRLMNMVIDHMSDGILLVDQSKKIVAMNHQMSNLLQCPAELLQGEQCDHKRIWDRFGIIDYPLFLNQLARIESDHQRSAQQRFESSHGTYTIRGIPIHDNLNERQGRLWIVTEVASQQHGEPNINEQIQRFMMLKHFASELSQVRTVDRLLELTVKHLHEFFNVETVGIAIRDQHPQGKLRQLLCRGHHHACELVPARAIMGAINTGLLPEIVASPDFAYWPDLDLSKGFWPNDSQRNSWRETFTNNNFTALAVGPLVDDAGAMQGIIWCAQRSGKRFDRHEMLMIEMIAPLVEARLEVVQLKESLQAIDLIDPVTQLPNQQQFHLAAENFDQATHGKWSLLMIDIEHLDRYKQLAGQTRVNELLANIAKVMQHTIRRNSFVSRYEGSVFSILIAETNPQVVLRLASRLKNQLERKLLTGADERLSLLAFRTGIAYSDSDGPSISSVLARAIARLEIGHDHVIDMPVYDKQSLMNQVAMQAIEPSELN